MRCMADDQLSDVYLKAASAVARVLAIRHNESTANTTEALREVELATRSVERQLSEAMGEDRSGFVEDEG